MPVTEDQQALGDLKMITRLVKRHLPPWLDREGLVVDIWMETQRRSVPITPILIRSRCIDCMIKSKRYHDNIRAWAQSRSSSTYTISEEELTHLHRALETAELDPAEKKLIFFYFYEGMSYRRIKEHLNWPIAVIARSLKSAIEKVRTAYRQL